MKCPYCGNEIPAGQSTCPSCGGSVPASAPAQVSAPQANTQQSPFTPPRYSTMDQTAVNQGASQHQGYSAAQAQLDSDKKKRTIIILIVAGLILLCCCVPTCAINSQSSDSVTDDLPVASSTTTTTTTQDDTTSTIDSTGATTTTTSNGATVTVYPTTWTDSYGNITLYALFEASGSDLDGLLTQQAYTYNGKSTRWTRADQISSLEAMTTTQAAITETSLSSLDPDGVCQEFAYLVVTGYDNPADILAAQNVVTKYTYQTGDVILAVCYGPSKTEHLVMIRDDNAEDGGYAVMVFSQHCVESGDFNSIMGGSYGTSFDEIWTNITGSAPSASNTGV